MSDIVERMRGEIAYMSANKAPVYAKSLAGSWSRFGAAWGACRASFSGRLVSWRRRVGLRIAGIDPASLDRVAEPTDAMIDAGYEVLCEFDPEFESRDHACRKIYLAMCRKGSDAPAESR